MFVKNITETTQKIRIDWVETEIGAWEVFQTTESKAEELVRNYPSIIGYADAEDISWSGDLSELDDVEITNPTDWQIMTFDETSDKWENSKIRKPSIQDKTILLMGDSYGDSNSIANPRVPLVISKLWLTKYYAISKGGHCFTGKDWAPSGTTWATLRWITDLQNFVANKTEEELADIDVCCIVWGFNDIYSTYTNIQTYMEAFFTYAKTVLPNAEFMLWMAGWADQVGSFTTPNTTYSWCAARLRLHTIVARAYRECAKYGCKYMGDLYLCLHNYWADFDNSKYHPNERGAQKIANNICNCLLWWNVTVYEWEVNEVFTKSGNTPTDQTFFHATQNWGVISVYNRVNSTTYAPELVSFKTAKAITRADNVSLNGIDTDESFTFKSWLIWAKDWDGSYNFICDLAINGVDNFYRTSFMVSTSWVPQFIAPVDIASWTSCTLRIRSTSVLADLT